MRATGARIATFVIAFALLLGAAGCGGGQKGNSGQESGRALTLYFDGDFQGALAYCRGLEGSGLAGMELESEMRACFAVRPAIYMVQQDMAMARQEIRLVCEAAPRYNTDKVGIAGMNLLLFLGQGQAESVQEWVLNQVLDMYLMECGISAEQLSQKVKEIMDQINRG